MPDTASPAQAQRALALLRPALGLDDAELLDEHFTPHGLCEGFCDGELYVTWLLGTPDGRSHVVTADVSRDDPMFEGQTSLGPDVVPPGLWPALTAVWLAPDDYVPANAEEAEVLRRLAREQRRQARAGEVRYQATLPAMSPDAVRALGLEPEDSTAPFPRFGIGYRSDDRPAPLGFYPGARDWAAEEGYDFDALPRWPTRDGEMRVTGLVFETTDPRWAARDAKSAAARQRAIDGLLDSAERLERIAERWVG